MKKFLFGLAVMAMTLSVLSPSVQAKGGFEGFLTGCCFGMRAAGDYNEQGTGDRSFLSWFLVGFCLGPRTQIDYTAGKDFHWREIGRVIPYVNIIFAIWDGFDGSGGKTRSDYRSTLGASYF